MKTGAELIAEERKRQIAVENYTSEHDDSHDEEELALAAACYALPLQVRGEIADRSNESGISTFFKRLWPWNLTQWKGDYAAHGSDYVSREVRRIDLRIRELAKAGALIAAEIDRLRRETVGTILERTMDPDARQ